MAKDMFEMLLDASGMPEHEWQRQYDQDGEKVPATSVQENGPM